MSGRRRPSTTQGATADIGEVAVIQDNGDIILPANAFDLGGVGLSFVPNASGGFDVRRGDATFQSDLGTRLTLTDDDASSTASGFSIPFYGTQHASAWVNSDGNITFGESDTASTERDVSRFLTGPAADRGVRSPTSTRPRAGPCSSTRGATPSP